MSNESILAIAGEWMMSGDTGTSSKAIFARMLGASTLGRRFGHPHDVGDFGRCYRLLRKIPAWRARLSEMSDCGPYWAGLVARWPEIEALYHKEAAFKEGQPTDCPETHALIREILDPIDDAEMASWEAE